VTDASHRTWRKVKISLMCARAASVQTQRKQMLNTRQGARRGNRVGLYNQEEDMYSLKLEEMYTNQSFTPPETLHVNQTCYDYIYYSAQKTLM